MFTPLKRVRELRGETTYEIARIIGIAQSHYSRVENGETGASPAVATKLALYFKGSITEMEILYPDRYQIAEGERKAS